ncbi:amino acid/amide ABC transporter substrate-binding protein, HAAT family [Faunimonas pinastri]|uniref:Amino acid/amide ABC transporter substrate-binding protein, HAAT family n=1 Tax=Faunimonas pinastri TaxID=1855383 RepID=A0A1H9NEE5_9HYPH|nr:transporter substrate-binding domain-containing protein [Faunimonas pinastri]SER33763.1 amino acid/amide ABC transporter substrate-binding protein, HAAT family [Faunimonas pinastri]
MERIFDLGVLYSTEGSYAALGQQGLAGARMAIDEVNASPDYGFSFRAEIADPRGRFDRYGPMCDALVRPGRVRHVIGGITSWSRKEVIPVVEKHEARLWYACPYEGFEANDHVFYLGACPNQHVLPLFAHAFETFGTRPFLVGSNYIWGWENNRIARELVTHGGGEVAGERCLPLGDTDVGRLIAEIRETRPDFVLNNLIGPSSYAFLRAYHALAQEDAAFLPERRPVLSCNLTELELDIVGPAAIGHIATASYFDSIPTGENRAFLGRVAARLGPKQRVSAFFVGAYSAVLLLAEAIRRTGTDDPAAIDAVAAECRPILPMGPLALDPLTKHAVLTPWLGRAVPGGRFELLEETGRIVMPDPYMASPLQDVRGLGDPTSRASQAPRLRLVQ